MPHGCRWPSELWLRRATTPRGRWRSGNRVGAARPRDDQIRIWRDVPSGTQIRCCAGKHCFRRRHALDAFVRANRASEAPIPLWRTTPKRRRQSASLRRHAAQLLPRRAGLRRQAARLRRPAAILRRQASRKLRPASRGAEDMGVTGRGWQARVPFAHNPAFGLVAKRITRHTPSLRIAERACCSTGRLLLLLHLLLPLRLGHSQRRDAALERPSRGRREAFQRDWLRWRPPIIGASKRGTPRHGAGAAAARGP